MDVWTNKLQDPQWWIEKICTDLYFACRVVYCTIEDPTPGYKDLYEPTHRLMCEFVQRYGTAGQELIVLTPRHWIKSYLVTVGWTLQRMVRNWVAGRREHFIISNATIKNAKQFLERIKFNLQYNELFRGLFRDYIPDDLENKSEKWTQDEFMIAGNQVETGSVEGNLVSQHYMVMINDDLVNKENSKTSDQIEKVIEWWRLARSLLSPNGTSINIGTRWGYDDLYGFLINKFIQPKPDYYKGLPVSILHRGKYHLLQMDCWSDPDTETGSTFPVLFPEKKLKEIFEEQGDAAYGQYRNDPLARGKNPFKREWFKRYLPENEPLQRHTLLLLDPTGTAGEDSDFTGVVVIDLCSDKKGYIRLGERRKITDMELAQYTIRKAVDYRPDMIGVETNKFGVIQDMLEMVIPQMLRKGDFQKHEVDYVKTIPYILVELKPGGRPKEARIQNLTGRVESGDFLFPMNGTEQLEQELIRFPTTKKKDIADAFAYVLDHMFFPKPDDPVKTLVLPAHLKETGEEREKRTWEEIKDIAYLGEQPIIDDDLW